jgi:DNA polymerase III subunit delta
MAKNPPAVYLLHGDDEFTITQYTARLKAMLGDSDMAEMNTIRLDGRTAAIEEIEMAASTPPFLVKRRLVIITHPTARLTAQASQKRFTELLDRIPLTIAMVLIEHKPLTDERDRKKNKIHWLERWADRAGDRVLKKTFMIPKGGNLVHWVQERARASGGEISAPAAVLLGSFSDGNPLIADQELQKLLAYVNYSRCIEKEDVEAVTADQGQGDVFKLVDAIGSGNGRLAVEMLHRLLEQQDALSIFGMVVRQFRLLLLIKEFSDEGGLVKDASMVLKLSLPPFVIEELYNQARRFDMVSLESIYKRLLDSDEAVKTGSMAGELSLDLLIADVTQ